MTLDELHQPGLPATVPFEEAYRTLGIGRTYAYQLGRCGRFPVPVFKVGVGRWLVPTAALRRALEVEEAAG